MTSLPFIVSSELSLIELRELGTLLIRLSGNSADSSSSSSSSKGSSASNASTSLVNEMDNYIANKGNQRAIKNFIAEITRVYIGVSSSSMRKITSYSLQDEKFDQFIIPYAMLQRLKDHIVMR